MCSYIGHVLSYYYLMLLYWIGLWPEWGEEIKWNTWPIDQPVCVMTCSRAWCVSSVVTSVSSINTACKHKHFVYSELGKLIEYLYLIFRANTWMCARVHNHRLSIWYIFRVLRFSNNSYNTRHMYFIRSQLTDSQFASFHIFVQFGLQVIPVLICVWNECSWFRLHAYNMHEYLSTI